MKPRAADLDREAIATPMSLQMNGLGLSAIRLGSKLFRWDLDRPVDRVGWDDAIDYCTKLAPVSARRGDCQRDGGAGSKWRIKNVEEAKKRLHGRLFLF